MRIIHAALKVVLISAVLSEATNLWCQEMVMLYRRKIGKKKLKQAVNWKLGISGIKGFVPLFII